MSSEIKAPYNFVPLSNWIFSPSWAEQVSQDIPFEDGVSGSIDLELTAISPLLIGSLKDKATSSKPALVEFFKVGDNPVIPGSSLKGMLRHTFEIANFGKMGRINDHRLAIRDLQNSMKEHYRDLIDINKIKAGILTFDREIGKWKIRKHEFIEVTQKEIATCYSDHKVFKNRQSVFDKYKSIDNDAGLVKNIFFKSIKDGNLKSGVRYKISKSRSEGYVSGRLIFTGQPNNSGVAVDRAKNHEKKRRNNKYFEYVFYEPSECLDIPEKIFSDFIDVYDKDGSDWRGWQKSGLAFSEGIPVFFQESQGIVSSFGLSKMYKLPYKNSISEVIENTAELHRKSEIIDFSDVIFGYMEDSSGQRGRVNVTPGRIVAGESYQEVGPVVLSQPKASYFPNYLEQKSSDYKTYMNDDARLRGWKRYILKGAVDDLDIGGIENYSVSSRLKPIREGSRFSFKLHFHNLKPIELGALIWIVNFGGDYDRFHSIGMGKSIGLGTVQLRITGAEISEIDDLEVSDLTLYKDLYVDFMDSLIGQSVFGRKWSDTDVFQGLDELTRISERPYESTFMSLKQYGDMKASGESMRALKSTKEARVKTTTMPHQKISYDETPVLPGLSDIEKYLNDRRDQKEENVISENIIRVKELHSSLDMKSTTWKKRLWKLLTDCKNQDWPEKDKAFLKENLLAFAYELDEKRASKFERLF